jgi:hypothetical protein
MAYNRQGYQKDAIFGNYGGKDDTDESDINSEYLNQPSGTSEEHSEDIIGRKPQAQGSIMGKYNVSNPSCNHH